MIVVVASLVVVALVMMMMMMMMIVKKMQEFFRRFDIKYIFIKESVNKLRTPIIFNIRFQPNRIFNLSN